MISGHRVIALEEHYSDELSAAPGQAFYAQLADIHEYRIPDMDRTGIDVQVLSLAPPGAQATEMGTAESTRQANDRLAALIAEAPDRLKGLAALPTAEPAAAAGELQRAIEDLGFCGALINGPTAGVFLDHSAYAPMFSKAAGLGVPIYLHPSPVLEPVREAYLSPYDKTHPMFAHAGWGFTIETGTHAMRLILSGLFDRCPDLQIILGHLGEAIPYLAPRIEEALARNTPLKNFTEVFKNHFHVTSSGFFSDRSLALCIELLGIERVMFSVDWPFASNQMAADWARRLNLAEPAKTLFLHGNAQRLLRI